MKKQHIRAITETALCTALIAVSAQISILVFASNIPYTLQTFALFLIAAVFGWKKSTIATVIYLALAAIGLPIMAGFKGGIAAIMGPTGGYALGFLFIALLTGIAAEKGKGNKWILLAGMVAGLLVCYAFGTVWFKYIYGTDKGLGAVLMLCVVPYLPVDAVKIVCAVLLAGRVKKALYKEN